VVWIAFLEDALTEFDKNLIACTSNGGARVYVLGRPGFYSLLQPSSSEAESTGTWS
jgi:hypothetical protein